MIHLNGWMSLQCTKIHLTSRISLHAGCVMCRLQKEVDVNASQMIFNFSDVFKCWAFTVSLMRARLSCIYKIYVSPHNALRNRQLLPLPVDRQSALLHRALVTGDLCCADLFCGCNLTHIPSDSSLKMCQILCKNPLRHQGAAGGPLGTLCVCAPMCAVFQILLFCPKKTAWTAPRLVWGDLRVAGALDAFQSVAFSLSCGLWGGRQGGSETTTEDEDCKWLCSRTSVWI